MGRFNPVGMLVVGTLLMILGVILPLLMVIKVLQSTFFLAFISYGASTMGMFLAFLGLFMIVRFRRK